MNSRASHPASGTPAPPGAPAQRLSIAFVMPPWLDVPPQAYGGIQSLTAHLIDALVERGHAVFLVGPGVNGTRAQFRRTYEVPPSERIGLALPETLNAAWSNRYLDELDVNVIHDNSLAGPLTAQIRRVPTVVTAHGSCTGEMASYYRLVCANTNLVAISDFQRQLAPDLCWAATVHNAVRTADFTFRERKEGHALFMGRISPEKGAHLAIDAARAAGRRILLAGKIQQPHEQEYFESEVRPRLGSDAEFVGEADAAAKQELYGAAHCLVFPICRDEPFGLVMIEAMACGTPVVALRRGFVPEVVLDGTTGYVREDPAGLPAAINSVGNIDPAACRRHVEENFDVSVMAARYERAYAKACGIG
jgi:glycosyltransferase involved in cell wall biosynthesis